MFAIKQLSLAALAWASLASHGLALGIDESNGDLTLIERGTDVSSSELDELALQERETVTVSAWGTSWKPWGKKKGTKTQKPRPAARDVEERDGKGRPGDNRQSWGNQKPQKPTEKFQSTRPGDNKKSWGNQKAPAPRKGGKKSGISKRDGKGRPGDNRQSWGNQKPQKPIEKFRSNRPGDNKKSWGNQKAPVTQKGGRKRALLRRDGKEKARIPGGNRQSWGNQKPQRPTEKFQSNKPGDNKKSWGNQKAPGPKKAARI